MVKSKNADTETRILEAAREIFLAKGMHGARMQEIADKAKINKAMLHYYFRNKQQLFDAVFQAAFTQMAPRLNEIINSSSPLFEKIRTFSYTYQSFLRKHPYLPGFIIQELTRDPQRITQIFQSHLLPDLSRFEEQVQEAIDRGQIRSIDPKQLLINMLSLNIFPYAGAPLIRLLTRSDQADYNQLMSARKDEVTHFIVEAIKLKE